MAIVKENYEFILTAFGVNDCISDGGVLECTEFYNMLNYLRTYLLTPWSTVLHEKLTGFQLVKKFPAFYGTRKFITAITSARHLSLS
jgi:hypothetical protein